ncbi:hypothetical protein K431DRAFT_345793 [Polychaeton citri CBS 116435]|uniref:Uncharacterized protein n=1 Tax=Polychaeton citri CBS 116435 TaxID=1314669 RepID=A0A9P4Q7H5_9PEZI|nr:hypothetical protein K431DRAFT_345793 [Polychaeton citri CBS 116435]
MPRAGQDPVNQYNAFGIGYMRMRTDEIIAGERINGEDRLYKVHIIYKRCARSVIGLYDPSCVLETKSEDAFLNPEATFESICEHLQGRIDRRLVLDGKMTTFDIEVHRWSRLLQPEDDQPGVNFNGLPFSNSSCGAWMVDQCYHASKEGKIVVLRIMFSVPRLPPMDAEPTMAEKLRATVKDWYARGLTGLVVRTFSGKHNETGD